MANQPVIPTKQKIREHTVEYIHNDNSYIRTDYHGFVYIKTADSIFTSLSIFATGAINLRYGDDVLFIFKHGSKERKMEKLFRAIGY